MAEAGMSLVLLVVIVFVAAVVFAGIEALARATWDWIRR